MEGYSQAHEVRPLRSTRTRLRLKGLWRGGGDSRPRVFARFDGAFAGLGPMPVILGMGSAVAASATVILAEVAEELVRTVLYLRVEAGFSS
jgi:hypothetical protein